MHKALSDSVFERMRQRALGLGVSGVGGLVQMLHEQDSQFQSATLLIGNKNGAFRLSNLGEGSGDNHIGLCSGMIAEMIRTNDHSGKSRRMNGEAGLGGLAYCSEALWTFIAFSGGTGFENLWISLAGFEAMGVTHAMIDKFSPIVFPKKQLV